MTAGIFGRKIGMTQIFDKDGSAIPVTLVKADPCQVCQIKTTKTDGYDAIQVGYLEEKLSKIQGENPFRSSQRDGLRYL